MAEKVKARKKRLQRNSKVDKLNQIKKMSMFGLRIETRDDFDEENYQDFRNIRREIKDKSHIYRIGPAPITDFQTKPKHYVVSSPGCLDSDLEDSLSMNRSSDDPMAMRATSLPYPTEDGSTHPPTHVSKAGCRSLISYFAKLGRHEGDEYIDLEFVDSLLRAGADINFSDKYGQTCMHEISRDWHTDVAQFALTRGANVNKSDNYGRTPLHLAAAVNYPEMVFWLINNGAEVDSRTVGEEQTPIHYAAKYNAEDSLKVLLHMGGNIADKDYKNRTPLFVAAEAGRSESCCFLLEQGAPAGVYDDVGRLALSLMVQKMPDVAKIALGQYVTVDKALRKKYYYLNYLETDTWKNIQTQNCDNNNNNNIKHHNKNRKKDSLSSAILEKVAFHKKAPKSNVFSTLAMSPLETICEYNEGEIVMHPVILRLIAIKWQLYGNYRTGLNTAVNLFYTLLWTALGVSMPRDNIDGYYSPLTKNIWRIVLEVISLILAIYFIVSQVVDVQRSQKRARKHKEWKKRELERDLLYCHERWPEEKRYLMSEINLIDTSAKSYLKNGWNGFEMFTNLIMAMVIFTRMVAVLLHNTTVNTFHYKSFPLLLILLWLRFMRYCQIYQSLGPFITMLSHVIGDTLKFGFLFFEFFIPYVCAFWILFGGQPGTEFENFNDVVYQVFLMTLVDEYDRDDMMKQDKIMAQILVGSYLAIASVVCLNLYIALMSQTFTRIYQNATATAYMQQANHLLKIERSLGKAKKNKVRKFMATECSPQVVYENGPGDDDEDDNIRLSLYRIVNSVNEIKDKMGGVVLDPSTSNITKSATGVDPQNQIQALTSLNSTTGGGSVQEIQFQKRLDNLEDVSHELDRKIDSVSDTLQIILDTIKNKTILNSANLTIQDAGDAAPGKVKKRVENQTTSSKQDPEQRNSWDQKLTSVINALTKSGYNQGYNNAGYAPSVNSTHSLDYRDMKRPHTAFDGGAARFFPPSSVNSPHSTLPRGGDGGDDGQHFDNSGYQFNQQQQQRHQHHQHPPGKFNSYQDIHSTQYNMQPMQQQQQRTVVGDEVHGHRPELRKMQSVPASYHQVSGGYQNSPITHRQQQSQGNWMTYENFDRPRGRNNRRYSDPDNPMRSYDYYDQQPRSSSSRISRRNRQEAASSRSKSLPRGGSKKHRRTGILSPERARKSDREEEERFYRKESKDDDDYYEGSSSSSPSPIEDRDDRGDYRIGFENVAEETKRDNQRTSGVNSKGVKSPSQRRSRRGSEQSSRESKKTSDSDFEKVSQLLNEHGISMGNFKENFKRIEEEQQETAATVKRNQGGATRKEMPSDLEDVMVEQVLDKAKYIDDAVPLPPPPSYLGLGDAGDRTINNGREEEMKPLLENTSNGNRRRVNRSGSLMADKLYQAGLKDTNV